VHVQPNLVETLRLNAVDPRAETVIQQSTVRLRWREAEGLGRPPARFMCGALSLHAPPKQFFPVLFELQQQLSASFGHLRLGASADLLPEVLVVIEELLDHN